MRISERKLRSMISESIAEALYQDSEIRDFDVDKAVARYIDFAQDLAYDIRTGAVTVEGGRYNSETIERALSGIAYCLSKLRRR